MAKAQICLSFIIFLYISSEGSFMKVNARQGQWCVAKPGVTDAELYRILAILCGVYDCTIISEGGGPCYTPDKLINIASVVMNRYYQDQGRQSTDCDFGGSSIIVVTDPSYEGCIYEFKQ